MCGRYTLTSSLETLTQTFPNFKFPPQLSSRYNIAPSQSVAVVVNDARHELQYFRWGLIPPWAKDMKIGNKMINARAETLAEKPSFRNAYHRRRCLVLADGFYEWSGSGRGKPKQPIYIRLNAHQPFAMAGLWETWRSPTGEVVPSCTIITTEPNELIAPYHHRMAVILPSALHSRWLAPSEQTPNALNDLLKPYPAHEMEAYPVSTLVNNVKYDGPECIIPMPSAPRLF